MITENAWKTAFGKWPAAIPRRGVLVNSLNEAMPFKSFLIKEDMLLLERTNPDPLGSRFILLDFASISSVRFIDPIKESVLHEAGFAGKLSQN
ncbi:MAG: hypothetical protein AB7G28_11040 [Pirellulales bacterium]